MPKKNNPGCICCQDPFCCDGTPPNTLQLQLSGVSGTGTNTACADVDCGTFWNDTVTVTRAGDSCTWGLNQYMDSAICANPKYGCFNFGFSFLRTWLYLIFKNDSGDWITRVQIAQYNSQGGPSQIIYFEDNSGATQPDCSRLAIDDALILDTSPRTYTCCDFSAATLDVQ